MVEEVGMEDNILGHLQVESTWWDCSIGVEIVDISGTIDIPVEICRR